MIGLVDGDDDFGPGGLRVAECFDGLGHDAIIGGDDEHDDVRDVRAAGAHGTKCRMAGRIKEGDLLHLRLPFRVREGNRVSADVLRDAAGFARDDIRLADDVEQRGLAVVDVAHDGHDRRARLEIFDLIFDVQLHLFDGRVDDAGALLAFFNFETKAVFRADFFGDIFIDRLVDGGEDVERDQIRDDLERLAFELLGQLAHHDGWLERNDFARGGLGKFRANRFRGLASRRLSRPAAGRKLLTAVLKTTALLLERRTAIRTTAKIRATSRRRRAGASGRKLDGTDFVTRAGGRLGQVDKADLVADLRARRSGR